jgi:hypothetical protein
MLQNITEINNSESMEAKLDPDLSVPKIYVNKLLTDEEMVERKGEYFDQSHYKQIFTTDVDVYINDPVNGERCLLKFRTNVIPKKLTDLALGYVPYAKKQTANRGAAAGRLDETKIPKYIDQLVESTKFRTKYINKDGKVNKANVGNMASSNIIGYFDQPDRNDKNYNGIPCRLTAFNKKHPIIWEKSVPFLRCCDRLFQQLHPMNHQKQWIRNQLTPNFAIEDTAFSTITINYSWRTALHKDAGDYKDGFGNLIVVEDYNNPNQYDGCFTGFPQYGVAVDVRTGCFLTMDVHEWHCNTEFIPRNNNHPVKDTEYNRLSIVCYLREKMIKCRGS